MKDIRKYLLRFMLAMAIVVVIIVANYFMFSKWAVKISDGDAIDLSERADTALLLIDIQEGTTGNISVNQGYLEQADSLILISNQYIAESLANGNPVIYIGSIVTNPLINILNNTLSKRSGGACYDSRLNIRSNYSILKHRNDAFHEKELTLLLDSLNIAHLELIGLDAAHCITSTAQGALNRGYKITIFENVVITDDRSTKKQALQVLSDMGVEIK